MVMMRRVLARWTGDLMRICIAEWVYGKMKAGTQKKGVAAMRRVLAHWTGELHSTHAAVNARNIREH